MIVSLLDLMNVFVQNSLGENRGLHVLQLFLEANPGYQSVTLQSVLTPKDLLAQFVDQGILHASKMYSHDAEGGELVVALLTQAEMENLTRFQVQENEEYVEVNGRSLD